MDDVEDLRLRMGQLVLSEVSLVVLLVLAGRCRLFIQLRT